MGVFNSFRDRFMQGPLGLLASQQTPQVPSQVPSQQTQFSQDAFGQLSPLVSDLISPDKMANSYLKQTYSGDANAISDRLGQYSAYDTSSLGSLADYLKPKAALSAGNQLFFKPQDFAAATSNLSGIDVDRANSYAPLLGSVQSLGVANGKSFFDKTALENQLAQYSMLDPSKLSDESAYDRMVKARAKTAGDLTYLTKDDVEWAKNPFGGMEFVDPAANVPAGFTKDENYVNLYGNGRVKYVNPTTGVEIYPFSRNAASLYEYANSAAPRVSNSLFQYLDMGYEKDAAGNLTAAEKSFFLPSSTLTPTGGDNAWYQTEGQGFNQDALKKHAIGTTVGDRTGWVFPTWQDYESAMQGSGADPLGGFGATNTVTTRKKSGGGFLGGLSSIMNAISPVLAFTPLAPVAAGWALGSGIGSGNIAQAISGGIGMFAPGLGGTIGKSLGATGLAANALGSGIINTGLGLASGQSFGDALKGGAIGGLAGYAGGALGSSDFAKGLGLSPTALNALSGATRGFVGAGLSGYNPIQGALQGGLSSGASGLAAGATNNKFVNSGLNAVGQSLLAQGLARNKRR